MKTITQVFNINTDKTFKRANVDNFLTTMRLLNLSEEYCLKMCDSSDIIKQNFKSIKNYFLSDNYNQVYFLCQNLSDSKNKNNCIKNDIIDNDFNKLKAMIDYYSNQGYDVYDLEEWDKIWADGEDTYTIEDRKWLLEQIK